MNTHSTHAEKATSLAHVADLMKIYLQLNVSEIPVTQLKIKQLLITPCTAVWKADKVHVLTEKRQGFFLITEVTPRLKTILQLTLVAEPLIGKTRLTGISTPTQPLVGRPLPRLLALNAKKALLAVLKVSFPENLTLTTLDKL
jgi:hypothetical protein